MPVLHPYMTGARGTGHGADYAIADPILAYVAIDLLADGGTGARGGAEPEPSADDARGLAALWQRLLGRPASESGRLRHEDEAHGPPATPRGH